MHPDDIARDPHCVTEAFDHGGEAMTFRVLREDDGVLFGRYLAGLSPATRSCFSPHKFTMATAAHLCATTDPSRRVRIAVTRQQDTRQEMIAYYILTLSVPESTARRFEGYGIALDGAQDCQFAPSVADSYQNGGLGTVIGGRVIELARRLQRRLMVLQGGTQLANVRGIHYYGKLGFCKVGEFTTQVGNQDMVLALRGGGV